MIQLIEAGDPKREKLDSIRGRITECEQELAALELAALTIDEAVASIFAVTQDDADRVRQWVGQRCLPGITEGLTGRIVDVARGTILQSSIDPLATHRALIGDQAFERLIRDLVTDVHPTSDAAVSAVDRHERRIKLKAKRERLLEQEEAELVALETMGLFAERRAPDGSEDIERFLDALSSS
jgi:hypothetical protein